MKKILTFTAMAALLVLGPSAKAQITGYLTQAGANPAQPCLQVQCDVDFVGPHLYTYSYIFTVGDRVSSPGLGYVFTPTSDNPVTSFTIDSSSIIPGSAVSSLGTALIIISSGEVVWNYAGPSFPNTDTVSFQSYWAPDFGNASANDGSPGVVWSTMGVGASEILVPNPIPEASTVVAAILMLIPLGVGFVRVIYKQRLVSLLLGG